MRRQSVSLVPALLVIAVLLSGCSFTWAARATMIARDVGDAVSQGMAEQTRAVTVKAKAKCTKSGTLDLPCYKAEIAPWKVHRENFRKYAAPAISSAVAGAYTGIKLAHDANADGDKVKAIGLGVVRAVLRMVDPFLMLIPAKYRDMVKSGSGIVKGLVCK